MGPRGMPACNCLNNRIGFEIFVYSIVACSVFKLQVLPDCFVHSQCPSPFVVIDQVIDDRDCTLLILRLGEVHIVLR